MTEDNMESIKRLIEDIKGLYILANQDKLDEIKKKLLKPGSVESQVYELCDGINTVRDIVTKLQKSQENIGAVISSLRRKGLIRTFERNGVKISEQVY